MLITIINESGTINLLKVLHLIVSFYLSLTDVSTLSNIVAMPSRYGFKTDL